MNIDPTIFKAYDIRGTYPDQINEDTARAIGRAYARWLSPKTVMVGRDVRISSPSLRTALVEGLTGEGVDVIDIGQISTDMLYYAVGSSGVDGGITVTASHNPKEYNGMKFIRKNAVAISSDTGLNDIAELTTVDHVDTEQPTGSVSEKDISSGYIDHVRSFVDITSIQPLTVVANANFGLATQMFTRALKGTSVTIEPLNEVPDGNFPKGRPDPLIPESRQETIEKVIATGADLGIAWDADADRCFFFDENGDFVDGYFITAILAKMLLAKHPGGKIIHDPRLIWAVQDTVKEAGGVPLINKAGHTFIKDRMRAEDALFAGEISAHYYFHDNYYCDNGMIPALLMLEHLSLTGQKLSEIAAPYRAKYFISGEINNEVDNGDAILARIKQDYKDGTLEEIDGLSVMYSDWRFNVRMSNTEPTMRLNVEAKSQKLMEAKRDELLAIIRS